MRLLTKNTVASQDIHILFSFKKKYVIFIKNKNLHQNVDISGLNAILSSPLCFTIFAKCSTKDAVLLL